MIRKIAAVIWLAPPALLAAQMPATQMEKPMERGGYLYFKGQGIPSPDAQGQTQRRSLAEGAAILDAKAKIARVVDALQTPDGQTVGQARQGDEKMETRVQAFLKGVESVHSSWDEEDRCVVTLRVRKKALLKGFNARRLPPW